jgi:hypothetical protein
MFCSHYRYKKECKWISRDYLDWLYQFFSNDIRKFIKVTTGINLYFISTTKIETKALYITECYFRLIA